MGNTPRSPRSRRHQTNPRETASSLWTVFSSTTPRLREGGWALRDRSLKLALVRATRLPSTFQRVLYHTRPTGTTSLDPGFPIPNTGFMGLQLSRPFVVTSTPPPPELAHSYRLLVGPMIKLRRSQFFRPAIDNIDVCAPETGSFGLYHLLHLLLRCVCPWHQDKVPQQHRLKLGRLRMVVDGVEMPCAHPPGCERKKRRSPKRRLPRP